MYLKMWHYLNILPRIWTESSDRVFVLWKHLSPVWQLWSIEAVKLKISGQFAKMKTMILVYNGCIEIRWDQSVKKFLFWI